MTTQQLLTESMIKTKILVSEIDEMSHADDTIAEIILRAAKKLDAYIEDKRMVGQKLTRLWPEHTRKIQRVLPAEYKRAYAQEEYDDSPKTLLQEAIRRLHDLAKDEAETLANYYRKLQENPRLETELGSDEDARRIIAEVKESEKDLAEFKSLTDDRKKLLLLHKLILQKKLQNNSFLREISKKGAISSKWVKIGIRDEDKIKKVYEALEIACECGRPLGPQIEARLARIEAEGNAL